ncbi:hypothetical protein BGP77_04070 [Saccharospirillum sp. MSK14-1]|uniref:DUF2254 domain-containing protein n=1 Tax=Saccharospirillum sp. MSK14-1 TaxID=1897632 RepID=UPI000D3BF8AF|nr:DUF2254 domain-containing protein [Saccharospirillum sp. MSK14-1]PTY36484.1 hypothetical protein BGP77_04070 [Saccharospirillum sp. MSK14-1]
MPDFINNLMTRIRASLWALPAAMSLLSGTVAMVLPLWDFSPSFSHDNWWLFSGDSGSARDLLSTLLSGIITMTSLVVSITVVVLSLAAGQMGPRLIRNFLIDRQIQMVIGLFASTIVFCLITLRSVSDDLSGDDLPHMAINLASVLSVLCLFALLFYVHKVARSIIADTLVTEVANDLEAAIARAGERHSDQSARRPVPDIDEPVAVIALQQRGYIQVIEYARLVTLACERGWLLRLHCQPGHFLLRAEQCLTVLRGPEPSDDDVVTLRGCFVVGKERTPTLDLEYSIRQLVEIAIRALSPGINDTFTAIAVINRLGGALEKACQSVQPPSQYADDEGQLRLLAPTQDFGGLVDTAFNQIRQSGTRSPAVLIQMGRILCALAAVADSDEQRRSVRAHLQKLRRCARTHIEEEDDLADFEAVVAPTLASNTGK